MPTIDERLRAIRSRIRLPVDATADALLDTLVAMGLQRARVDDAADGRGDEAVDNFRRLIDDLTQQARILRLDAIPAPSIVSALERLCPLWPFCVSGCA